ncbi:hypothetical protein Pla163_29760 [Planctomycetes bacterium Pla163]|uniref:Uncharacterized protein n=1 Tax=Rohdeia mirabilis TaxID=2528008 RepID=A0A518D302_9BACT|nr:hypothetical protein Pla163_29760 [Planctomycetes bacterium Pla163]
MAITELTDAAIESCWRQWEALGGHGSSHGLEPCQSLVDPEALIVLSSVLEAFDPRLGERLAWWAAVGAQHTSVQRVRTIAASLPAPESNAWRVFASNAAAFGTGSWKAHAQGEHVSAAFGGNGERAAASLVRAPSLMVRLRYAFGVNSKSDLLALLIGSDGQRITAKEASRHLACSESTAKRAANDMARSGLIRSNSQQPIQYWTESQHWREVLELDAPSDRGVPRWRPWCRIAPFLVHATSWERSVWPSDYLRASAARSLFDTYRSDLESAGLDLPDPARARGEAFTAAFATLLLDVAAWYRAG